jgi:hypothetical protein
VAAPSAADVFLSTAPWSPDSSQQLELESHYVIHFSSYSSFLLPVAFVQRSYSIFNPVIFLCATPAMSLIGYDLIFANGSKREQLLTKTERKDTVQNA